MDRYSLFWRRNNRQKHGYVSREKSSPCLPKCLDIQQSGLVKFRPMRRIRRAFLKSWDYRTEAQHETENCPASHRRNPLSYAGSWSDGLTLPKSPCHWPSGPKCVMVTFVPLTLGTSNFRHLTWFLFPLASLPGSFWHLWDPPAGWFSREETCQIVLENMELVPIYQNRIIFAKDLSSKTFSPPRHQDTKLNYDK